MVWYVRDAQVRDLVTSEEAIAIIEEVFTPGDGGIVNRPTVELPLPRSVLRVKVGADLRHGRFGFKAYPAGGRYLIVLYDVEHGLDAIVEGRQLTELRTGAVSAVGTRYLARPDATTLGIIGTGREARQQLASLLLVRPLETAWCYSPNPEHRAEFAREMGEKFGITVIAVDDPEACVRDADVVTTITSANEPVLLGAWLRPGTHVNAVGATTPERRELDTDAVARSATIVVELKEGARQEIGELIAAEAERRISWEAVDELQDVVSGAARGRQHATDITLFDTVGVGAEDIALAGFVAARARAAGVGAELDFEPPYNLSATRQATDRP